jgi:hypothetical protein
VERTESPPLITSTSDGKSDSNDESKHESESENESESKFKLGSGMNSLALALPLSDSLSASGERIEGSASDVLASPLSASGEFEVREKSKPITRHPSLVTIIIVASKTIILKYETLNKVASASGERFSASVELVEPFDPLSASKNSFVDVSFSTLDNIFNICRKVYE